MNESQVVEWLRELCLLQMEELRKSREEILNLKMVLSEHFFV